MAKLPANVARIWIDEHPLSAYLVASGLKVQQETPEVTTFADAGPRRVVGNYDDSGDHGALFDGTSGAIDDWVTNNLKSDEDHYIGQAWEGDTVGKVCYERVIRIGQDTRATKTGAAALLDFSDVGSGHVSRSTILHTGAITGTGNQTGQNLGATSANTILQVVYRVVAVSGSGSITFALQESSDDGGGDAYADISSMGATFTDVGVQRFTTTSATEAYKRLRCSAFSGFTSVTVLATVGTVAGT